MHDILNDVNDPEEFYELNDGDHTWSIMNDIPVIEQSLSY